MSKTLEHARIALKGARICLINRDQSPHESRVLGAINTALDEIEKEKAANAGPKDTAPE